MTDKQQWNVDFYNQQHNFVTEYGRDIVALLAPQAEEIILDLGCGSGELTQQIAQSCQQAYGIDFSASMIEKAKHNYPNLIFQQHDAQQEFPFAQKFDAIFSNAALHWMPNASAVVANIANSLNSGGRFVFEMGGKGNVANVLATIQQAAKQYNLGQLPIVNYYPSIAEYATILEQYGLQVKFAKLFARPTLLNSEHGLANWVKMFRTSVLDLIDLDQQCDFLNLVETIGAQNELLYRNQQWFADYVRLRMVAIKS
ncbi:MAG: hypothetical protein RLZZ293_1176 [Pseudomonadota bacterium]|jgi:trans-aconitate methyltransferase